MFWQRTNSAHAEKLCSLDGQERPMLTTAILLNTTTDVVGPWPTFLSAIPNRGPI
jgi:hypothetical protein